MKTLITITGKPRTGKDTLLAALSQELGADLRVLSSIEPVRVWVRELRLRLGLPTADKDRQLLAELKGALDRHVDFTARLALRELFFSAEPILAYQVREPNNLRALRDGCKVAGVHMLAVYVTRADRPETDMAFTDHVEPDADFPFDLLLETKNPDWPRLARAVVGALRVTQAVAAPRLS